MSPNTIARLGHNYVIVHVSLDSTANGGPSIEGSLSPFTSYPLPTKRQLNLPSLPQSNKQGDTATPSDRLSRLSLQ
jgi:hypothetical protein